MIVYACHMSTFLKENALENFFHISFFNQDLDTVWYVFVCSQNIVFKG